jgi:TonB family protein
MRAQTALLVLLLALGSSAQDAHSPQSDQQDSGPQSNAAAQQDTHPGGAAVTQPMLPNSEEAPTSLCSNAGNVISHGQMKGKLVHKVKPNYPEKARRAGIQGTVVMCALIGKDGKIKDLKLVSGPPELVPAAMKAVEKWRYTPFQVNNEPMEVQTDISVNFSLTQ